MSSLGDKIVAISRALSAAGIPYAFGGAQALAYSVAEPRSTNDIDVNVFVAPEDAGRVLDSLPAGIPVSDEERIRTARDGQVRLWWGDTAVDLFLATVEFHGDAATRIRTVPFGGEDIPILSSTDLAVCKALFSRPKDWLDIEAMRDAGTIDVDGALFWVGRLVGEHDDSYRRLQRVLTTPPSAPTGHDELPPALRPRPAVPGE